MAYKNRICGIYKIQNILNGKVYIGSSVHIMSRWSRHRSDLEKNRSTSIKLQLSYNKNGKDNFKFSIIEECSIDDLLIKEQFYIDLFDSYNKGYNSVKFAGHTLGFSPTQETRDKMRKTMLERNSFKGRKHSEETKELLRIINTGKKLSEEHKRKISENSSRHYLGKNLSKEHKENLSKSRILKYGTKVMCIETGEIFGSYVEAGRKFGVSHAAIYQAIKNSSKSKGFTFKKIIKEND